MADVRLARSRAPLLAVAAFAVAAAAASIAGRLGEHHQRRRSHDALVRHTPAVGRAGYVGSAACAPCHPAAHASWSATYHRTMTQRAGPGSVLAPFDGRALDGPAGPHRPLRRGDEFWAELPDPEVKLARAADGLPLGHVPTVTRRVVMTTGAHHMQVYWVESPRDRRLHAFPSAWLTDEQRWVPVESTLLRPPQGDVVYTWNRACVPCHAVAGQPRIDDERVDTRVAELGIACESCHGPGRAHVDARRSPLARYALHLSSEPDPSIVQPARLDHRRSAELCGQCHGVARFPDEAAWLARGDAYRPGEPLAPHRQLVRHPVREAQPWLDAVLDEDPEYLAGRMWSDGHVRVTGREYTALLETACFQRGELSCLSCHQLHGADPDDQLAASARGDGACTSCHVLPDIQAHTRHPAGSVSCYDCHMPRTTYGLLKAIRSHVIDSPDLAVTLATGRPDACSLCHVDRPLAWTADRLRAWYGQPEPELDGDQRTVSAAVLWAISGDAGQRALAADALGRGDVVGPDWRAPLLAHLLADPYDAVRQIAARGLRRLPSAAGVDLDALAPPEARAAAAAEVLTRWRAGPRPAPDPARLVDAAGDHDGAAVQALAARRDERPIDLKE
ncbi:HEAT repeat domain-containing protein [Nannocystis punicea]|uniref:Ammonia-forming cytochrome c nitrite reductase subunit c552 n=1 Tax=Nannocystis punicea TaxID=2995304 RepID=A0ABY7H7B4_9BACT|nr:cytochrome c3 family protein [Nannocystis poenicansa]WAS95161.1 ammonia-forming cytochrome c nitrite reductase subunit c552 [Nannocystis poenicansa]